MSKENTSKAPRLPRTEPTGPFNPLRRLIAAILVQALMDYLYTPKKTRYRRKTQEETASEAFDFLKDPNVIELFIEYFEIPKASVEEILGVSINGIIAITGDNGRNRHF